MGNKRGFRCFPGMILMDEIESAIYVLDAHFFFSLLDAAVLWGHRDDG